MSKLLIIVGTILEIAAMAFLFNSLFDVENSPVTQVIAAIACKPHEQMVTETEWWSQPNGESGQTTYYYCEIEPGQQREVTSTAFVILAAGFTIPLLLGIAFTIIGIRGAARQHSRKYAARMEDYFSTMPQTKTSSTVINLRGDSDQIPPETREILNNVLGGFANTFTSIPDKGSLTERLQQLDEAYHKNLISKDEYDRVRQAILDSMDD